MGYAGVHAFRYLVFHGEEFTAVIRRDLARWQKVIAEAKIRVE